MRARRDRDPWVRIRAWWGIAELDEDEQMEWLAREGAAQAENECREADMANEESAA